MESLISLGRHNTYRDEMFLPGFANAAARAVHIFPDVRGSNSGKLPRQTPRLPPDVPGTTHNTRTACATIHVAAAHSSPTVPADRPYKTRRAGRVVSISSPDDDDDDGDGSNHHPDRGRAMARFVTKQTSATLLVVAAAAAFLLAAAAAADASPPPSYDYAGAFDKCLRFFEAQRSGKLPADNRVKWRGDSALTDGFSQGVRTRCCSQFSSLSIAGRPDRSADRSPQPLHCIASRGA